jgi:hypothetical protein
MAQDPPEVTGALDADVDGVVVAGARVVDEVAGVVPEPPDEAVGDVDPAVVGLVVVPDVAGVALVEAWCVVWADARPAKRATPATQAPATDAVIRRVRRRIKSREAGEVMSPLSGTRLGGS